MKFIHLADLHLGKRLNEFSLIDDQKYILNEITSIIDEEKVDGVFIAGDIYDKSIATNEAVSLFDNFLTLLSKRNLKVFAISGNHDSAERFSFGGRIMDNSGIYLSPVYDGNVKKVALTDDYGNINIYLLPYLRPSNVRRYFPEAEISSYTDALKIVVDSMNIDKNERNILLCHQFVTGAERSDSEDISVGGLDNINGEIFADFDYVALGHIHKSQNILNNLRYSGTPLKYSFSEVNHKKTATIVEFLNKGNMNIKEIPLVPQHDLREIKGKFDDIVKRDFYINTKTDDYLHITLTDEEEILDAINKLRVIYPNIMKLDYDNRRTRQNQVIDADEAVTHLTPLELFENLYKKQNNNELNDTQKEFLNSLIEEIWGK